MFEGELMAVISNSIVSLNFSLKVLPYHYQNFEEANMSTNSQLITALLLTSMLTACDSDSTPNKDEKQKELSPINFRVVSYNAWQGGANINDSINKSIDWLLRQRPDVITIQEGSEIAQTYAALLQKETGKVWHVYNPAAGFNSDNLQHSTAIISRFPIVEGMTTAGSENFYRSSEGARIRLSEQQEVVVWSAHLSSTSYNASRSVCNWTESDLEKSGQYRVAEINKIFAAMTDNSGVDYTHTPVIIAGDFNAASHLDWTERAALGTVVPCQRDFRESQYMESVGFVDAFRENNPDEIKDTGFSWGVPTGEVGEGKGYPAARIDFIYYKGSRMLAVESDIFGMHPEQQPGKGGVFRNNPYPSDHYGFVTEFKIDKPSGVVSGFENIDTNTQIQINSVDKQQLSVTLGNEPEAVAGISSGQPFIGVYAKGQFPHHAGQDGIFDNAIKAQRLTDSGTYYFNFSDQPLSAGQYEVRVYRKDRTRTNGDKSPLQSGAKVFVL